MFVLVAQYQIQCPQCFSLKDKRQHRYRMIERLKEKYNISIIESGSQDHYKQLEIGFALVHQEESSLQEIFQKIEEDLYQLSPGQVFLLEKEIF